MKIQYIAFCLILFVTGCAQEFWHNSGKEEPYLLEQTYSITKVREKLNQIKIGMTKRAVFDILGQPGMVSQDAWGYLIINEDGFHMMNSDIKAVHIIFRDEKVSKIDNQAGGLKMPVLDVKKNKDSN